MDLSRDFLLLLDHNPSFTPFATVSSASAVPTSLRLSRALSAVIVGMPVRLRWFLNRRRLAKRLCNGAFVDVLQIIVIYSSSRAC